jgi:hypothetical protein
MAIVMMDRDEVCQRKIDIEMKKLASLEEEVVQEIKIAIGRLVDLEHLYDLREYIENLLVEWESIEFDEYEDED